MTCACGMLQAELQERLASAGLPTTGKKADLIARLTDSPGIGSGPTQTVSMDGTSRKAGKTDLAARRPRAAVSDAVQAAAAEERSTTEDIVVRGREARRARWSPCPLHLRSLGLGHPDFLIPWSVVVCHTQFPWVMLKPGWPHQHVFRAEVVVLPLVC